MLFMRPMKFSDRFTLDGTRRTGDGYLVTTAKVSRTGIQEYSGREVDPENKHGMRDKAKVRVWRDPAEVFSKDSLPTYAYRPITVDHPSERVTADNHKKLAVGMTGAEITYDENFVYVPMMLTDAAAIAAVEGGKRELSQGYDCDMDYTAGVTKDGLEYDAAQRNIKINHTALVDFARGGPELHIGDTDTMPKSMTIDGHTVEVSDAAAIAIGNLQTKLTDTATALTAAQTQVGTLTAALSTKDGENAVLKQQIADAALTPAKIDAAVTARAKVIDAAKLIFPAIVTDGKTDAAIRKEAVVFKITDAATMDDNAISGAFAALAATVTVDTMTAGIKTIKPNVTADKAVADARSEMIAALTH